MAQKHITNYFKNTSSENVSIDESTNNKKRKHSSNEINEINSSEKKYKDAEPSSKLVHKTPDYDNNIHSNLIQSTVKELNTNEFCEPQVKLEPKTKEYNILKSGDVLGAGYNPSKKKYHPINDAFWTKGQLTPYLALSRTFQLIEETQGRLKMIDTLSNFFRSVLVLNPNDILPCIYLCLNQLAPAYEGLELGVAELSVVRAISRATGQSTNHLKSQIEVYGDLGLVAEKARSSQCLMYQPSPLNVAGVFEKLKEIAKLSGQSAMNKKIEKIQTLFVSCRLSEARFIIRSLLGKLRIGIAQQSLIQALAVALTNTPINDMKNSQNILCVLDEVGEVNFKAAVEINISLLKTTYCQCPNYNKIVHFLLQYGIENLTKNCPMEPGTPIKPMLAQPTNGLHEVLKRFENSRFTCEWKYDGERAQIHCDKNGLVTIYSRNEENHTLKYPDIISRINSVMHSSVTSFMIDSEIVAWDIQKKQILPFQILSTRKRKNVKREEIKVEVCVFMFDLLYINGESLVTKNLAERRQLLKENFIEVDDHWQYTTSIDTNDMDDVQDFLDKSIKGNCEGLMIKTLDIDATYEIAKRSRNWLKLKKDYLTGFGDSLDLVVIGGYKGKGKRTGVYGGFLLACYDVNNEEYQSICKIGTGFSSEDLKMHTNNLNDHIIKTSKSYYLFESSLEPDVWFDPVLVWEVKCADLSLSPVHKAGIGEVDPEKGISLRFPRFIRIRTDKSPEDATSTQQVVSMYLSQDQIKNQSQSTVNEYENEY